MSATRARRGIEAIASIQSILKEGFKKSAKRTGKRDQVRRANVNALTKAKRLPKRGDEVFELLRRKNGATIADMVTRFGMQPHSLRALISVETRKRGLTVELVGKAHYRIV